MAEEDVVAILQALLRDDGQAIEQQYGPQGVSTAEDIESLISTRIQDHPPFASLWADFETDPDGTAAQLVGALEAMVEADFGLASGLNSMVERYNEIAARATEQRPLPEEAPDAVPDGAAIDMGVDPDPTDDYVEGPAYLYGNVASENDALQQELAAGPGDEDDLDSVEVVTPAPGLFDQLFMAVDEHPGLERAGKAAVLAELRDLQNLVEWGDASDEDSLVDHLMQVGRLAPDIYDILLDELIDIAPDVGDTLERALERVRAQR